MPGLWLLLAVALSQHDHSQMQMGPRWQWRLDATGTLNLNLQERAFTDFHQIESQNWLMLMGGRRVAAGRLDVHAMASLEPFTLGELGSAQAFQTGETFDRRPLIDYQHPHDLAMALGATWTGNANGKTRWALTGAVVGEPTLGPTAFMHRASSEGNPTAPLSHHTVDSTHITHGVVAASVAHGGVTLEASAFHGREPDENRLDIEMGKLDSVAGRVWFRRGGWAAQVSGGHLTRPDATEFSNLNRYTASVEYSGGSARPVSFTAVFGMNHHPQLSGSDVKEFAWLADLAWRVRPRDLVYARAELVDKDILEAGGYDPPEFVHAHPLSRVGAMTVGYQRGIGGVGRAVFGLGADVTVYRTPANLRVAYGHPVSIHLLLSARTRR